MYVKKFVMRNFLEMSWRQFWTTAHVVTPEVTIAYRNQNSLDIKRNLRVFDASLMKLCFDVQITWGELK